MTSRHCCSHGARVEHQLPPILNNEPPEPCSLLTGSLTLLPRPLQPWSADWNNIGTIVSGSIGVKDNIKSISWIQLPRLSVNCDAWSWKDLIYFWFSIKQKTFVCWFWNFSNCCEIKFVVYCSVEHLSSLWIESKRKILISFHLVQ